MSDASSGRDPRNAGSDSKRHYGRGTAYDQHQNTGKQGPAAPTTGRSFVRDQKLTKADSAPMASGNVSPSDADAK